MTVKHATKKGEIGLFATFPASPYTEEELKTLASVYALILSPDWPVEGEPPSDLEASKFAGLSEAARMDEMLRRFNEDEQTLSAMNHLEFT